MPSTQLYLIAEVQNHCEYKNDKRLKNVSQIPINYVLFLSLIV